MKTYLTEILRFNPKLSPLKGDTFWMMKQDGDNLNYVYFRFSFKRKTEETSATSVG